MWISFLKVFKVVRGTISDNKYFAFLLRYYCIYRIEEYLTSIVY